MTGLMISKILNYFDELIPNPKCELNYCSDFEFLIAVVLSAQTTDYKVNSVTKELFKYDINSLKIEEINNIIKPIGMSLKKSYYVKGIAKYVSKYGIPKSKDELLKLDGVGNKTGNLVSYTLGELMAGNEATFGPALQPYDFIYVDDLIEAVYRLGEKETDKAFYYIGSGSPRQLKEYLLRIGQLAGYADKVGIGIRPDDGIKYSMDMFCNDDLVDAVGEYVSTDFDNGINKTIEWLKSL